MQVRVRRELLMCLILCALTAASEFVLSDSKVKWRNVAFVPDSDRDLIVGGSLASPESAAAHAVSDPLRSGGLCGAALIHPDILVSAAHCGAGGVFYLGAVMYIGTTVLTGSDTVDEIPIVDGLYHPNYDESTFGNDIMLLKLESPATSPLVPWNRDANVPEIDDELVVVGFGLTEDGLSSFNLLEGRLNVIDSETCNDAFNVLGEASIFDETTICAASDTQATCSGDSGSPLLTESGTLVGIVSFGIRDTLNDVCVASTLYPAGFTRVSANVNFITEGICELSDDPPTSCTNPTRRPIAPPIRRPIPRPVQRPVQRPTARPIRRPTKRPTRRPTPRPKTRPPFRPPSTKTPTRSPLPPTLLPTVTAAPSRTLRFSLSVPPTLKASSSPSHRPSLVPLSSPTRRPSFSPTQRPSVSLSDTPSSLPSSTPSTNSVPFTTFVPTNTAVNNTVSDTPSQIPATAQPSQFPVVELNSGNVTALPRAVNVTASSVSRAPTASERTSSAVDRSWGYRLWLSLAGAVWMFLI